MITVQYKEGNEWKTDDKTFTTLDMAKAHTVKEGYGTWETDDATFLLLDQAKAHAVAEGYSEYKACDADDAERVMAHLFNAVKPKAKKKVKPKVKPLEEENKVTVAVRLVPREEKADDA